MSLKINYQNSSDAAFPMNWLVILEPKNLLIPIYDLKTSNYPVLKTVIRSMVWLSGNIWGVCMYYMTKLQQRSNFDGKGLKESTLMFSFCLYIHSAPLMLSSLQGCSLKHVVHSVRRQALQAEFTHSNHHATFEKLQVYTSHLRMLYSYWFRHKE